MVELHRFLDNYIHRVKGVHEIIMYIELKVYAQKCK